MEELCDKFRIKIWDVETGEVIYDNQMGEGDDSNAGTEIVEDNIIIHESKSK